MAADIADGTPAAAVGIRARRSAARHQRPPDRGSGRRRRVLHGAGRGETLRYTVLRLGSRDVIDVRVAPIPGGPGILYFLLAGVGTFTLLVGGAVRLRRPRDPATLHFLWLSVAFFGVFTFSFSGRLDRLDWVFFWADEISILALPPLFLHFTLVFPERPTRLNSTRARARCSRSSNYAPALVLGLAARGVGGAALRPMRRSSSESAPRSTGCEFLYLAVCFIGGLFGLTPRAPPQVRTVTARRQLRWIAWGTAFGAGPFAFGYALPYALGVAPSMPMQLSAIPLSLIPLAYASAIVRYRLMDVEVIVKRALVYAAVLSAVVAMYVVLLKVVQRMFDQGSAGHEWVIAFLATLVAVLLAPPVKDFVQTTLDRAFYRDRYDYRRALVGFARDLNSDLDLGRLSARLVSRVVETLEVDRMALMVESESGPALASMHAYGFGDRAAGAAEALGHRPPPGGRPPGGARRSHGGRLVRGRGDRVLARRRPLLLRAVHRADGRDRGARARPQAFERAAQQRGHGAAGRGRGPDGHRARERAALPPAAREGARARSPARVQREHPRVARRRPAGRGPRRQGRAVEHRARNALRRVAQRRRRPRARRPVRRPVRRGDSGGAARFARPAPCCRACRCTAAAPRRADAHRQLRGRAAADHASTDGATPPSGTSSSSRT